MKTTRKLFPALAMLLLAAVMMSTATYAWFSMNTTVTASGMSVKAEVNETFLLISNNVDAKNDPTVIQNAQGDKTKVTINEAATAVYPSEPVIVEDTTTNDTLEFQYYQGADFDNGAPTGTAQNVGKSTSYVKEYVYYITVAKNSPKAEKIVVSSVTFEGEAGSEAAAVVVATDYACIKFTEDTTTQSKVISGNLEITDSTVFEVHVYVYIDGNHESIKTSNAANLKDATIKIQFSVQKEDVNP